MYRASLLLELPVPGPGGGEQKHPKRKQTWATNLFKRNIERERKRRLVLSRLIKKDEPVVWASGFNVSLLCFGYVVVAATAAVAASDYANFTRST